MHFQLRMPQGTKDIELWLSVVPAGKRNPTWCLFHTYSAHEQYPLGHDRLINNRRNLFVDIAQLIEQNAQIDNPSQDFTLELSEGAEQSKESDYSVVSLKSLAQRAARVAADGSGNARRFKDARSLWDKLSNHTENILAQSLDAPITKVRKSHNWKKNQPYKDVTVYPQAWFVFNVYSRSNPRKDAFVAVHSVEKIWEYIAENFSDDEKKLALVEQQRSSALLNCDYPTYAEIAALIADSNMLVFPTDASFVQWIREVAGQTDEVARETPVDTYYDAPENVDEDSPDYIPQHFTGTVLHLANVLEKKGARTENRTEN
ncbi:hypothetical protein [Alloscardovia omnicolens]|uniref:hypothetical protein n=1 Tax=Alloscardovia omnicolens TaxID=419015 RepID=UPI003A6E07A4